MEHVKILSWEAADGNNLFSLSRKGGRELWDVLSTLSWDKNK